MNAPTIHRTGFAAAAAVAAAVLTLGATACGSSSSSSESTVGGGAGNTVTVTAKNIAFTPTSVTVPAGSEVTISFVNSDSVLHSLTFDDNSTSVDASGGETQTLMFSAGAAGRTIHFHCKYHSSMHGTITVGGAAAAGSGASSSSSGGGYYGG